MVVNGDFATDSNWSKDANWSIANGVATSNGFGRMFQSIPFLETNVGTKVKVSFDITEKTNGGVVVNCYGGVSQLFTSVGTHTFVTTTINSTNLYFNNVGAGGGFIGSIDNVSVKEYLGQEVVPDSGCGSWLFEPQSTNLITQSELFSHSSWVKNQTINENATISPSGLLDATKITCTSNIYNYIFRNPSFPSGNYTNSIFLKKDASSGWVALRIWTGGGANGISVWFDLDNNQIGTSNSNVAGFTLTGVTSKHLGNDWYRLSVSGTTDSNSYISLNFVDGDGLNTYTNVSSSGKSCFIWGAQVEVGNISSYIPTEGASVTRNQDVCTNGGSSASINNTEGTLYFEGAALANDGTFRQISLTQTAGGGDVITLDYSSSSNGIRSYLRVGAVSQSLTYILSDETQYNKIAVRYKDTHSIWVNGLEVASQALTTLPINLNVLTFDNGSGGGNLYGKTKAVAVWKEALSDQELSELTTI